MEKVLLIPGNPGYVELLKQLHRDLDMTPIGVTAQVLYSPQLLTDSNVRAIIIFSEETGLSPDNTSKLLDKLACVPNPPAVFLCTDCRELAIHKAVTWQFPRNTSAASIVDHIRAFTYPCGTLAEQWRVEDILMDFTLVPGSLSFLYLRDTVLAALHRPLGSGQTLDGIIREVAAFHGASRSSVSQSIHFSAKSLFNDPIGLSKVMKYSPETYENLQRKGRTFPTNTEYVLMFTNLLKASS